MRPDGSNPQLAWARYTLARRVLGEVTTAARRVGVDVLAVKGVVTSPWLYRDPSERLLTDVDVRVRVQDFGRMVRLARTEKWGIARCMWSYLNVDLEVDGMQVDVEGTLGPPGMLALTVNDVLARASKDSSGFWVPEIHDHAVLMTVNVFKDKLVEATPWGLEDAYRVVQASEFDAVKFVDRVREGRVTALAWIVADWMVAHRGSEAWGAIRERLGGDRPRRRLYTAMMRKLLSGDPGSLPLRLATRGASDDPWRVPLALGLAGAWELESRWDALRRDS